MTRFQVNFKDVLEDYPEIAEEFIHNLRSSNSLYKDTDVDDIRWYYTWELDYTDTDTENENDEIYRFNLKYEDRFNYELSKVKVDVTMKAGQFKRRDRVKSSVIPETVIRTFDEVIKIIMIEEQKFFTNDDVVSSIPPLDENLSYSESVEYEESFDYDDIDESLFDGIEEDIDYDLDTILEKISENGIDSITDAEKRFLDNQSNS